MQLVEEVKFDNSYSFIYSQRPGTPAAGMKDNVSDAEKKAEAQRTSGTFKCVCN